MSNFKGNPIQLAKDGDCKAIDFLINRHLKNQGIWVRSVLQNGFLRIVCCAETVPDPEKLVPFIANGITRLGLQSAVALEIYGKCNADSDFSWERRLWLRESPPAVAESKGTKESQASSQLNTPQVIKPDKNGKTLQKRKTSKVSKLAEMVRMAARSYDAGQRETAIKLIGIVASKLEGPEDERYLDALVRQDIQNSQIRYYFQSIIFGKGGTSISQG